MHDRKSKVAVIEKFLGLRQAGESRLAFDMFTPDAVYRIVGGAKFGPYAGPFVGPEAICDALYRLSVNFEFLDLKTTLIVIENDNACVRWSGRWENRGTGEGAWTEGIVHLVLREGRIAAYTNCLDTATVAEFSGWN